MFIGVFAALILQVALVVLVVLGARRLVRPGSAITAVHVRQLFQYVLLYGLVVVVAIGATELLSRALGASADSFDPSDIALARSLGFVVVGGALLLLLGLWTHKRLRSDPHTENTAIYASYLTLTALTALLVSAFSLGPTLGNAADGYVNGRGISTVVVWGFVWLVHWTLTQRDLSQERNTPHLLLGSLVAVGFATTGFVFTFQAAANLAIAPSLVIGGSAPAATSAGFLIAGALIWVRYWVTHAQGLPRGPLWMLFTLPLGVGGGLALALGAGGLFLWKTLVWFLGVPGMQTAGQYFTATATQAALALAGLIIWWYFRTTLGERVSEDPTSRRIYLYLMSGIGLLTAAVGAVAVVGAFVESIVGARQVHSSPINTVLAGVILLGIGTSVWVVFWRRIQRLVTVDPEAEVHAPARRIYLLLWIWGGGVVGAIALIVLAVELFQVLVSGSSLSEALYSSRFALGIILVAVTLSVYHGMSYKPAPRTARAPKSLLIIGHHPDVARELREALGNATTIQDGATLVELPTHPAAVAGFFADHAGQDLIVLVPQDLTAPSAGSLSPDQPAPPAGPLGTELPAMIPTPQT